MKVNVALLGHSGYVGSYFKEYIEVKFPYKFNLFLCDYRVLLENKLNFQKKFLKDIDLVINCAGYTGKPNVDACESKNNQLECWSGNVNIPFALGEICKKNSIDLIHISSGCIFNNEDLSSSKQFSESDVPNFSFHSPSHSYYSGTKVCGEMALGYRNKNGVWSNDDEKNIYIFRLRIPFTNSLKDERSILNKIKKYPKLLNFVNSMTYLEEFVYNILESYGNLDYGIYNLTNPNPISTKEIYEIMKEYNFCSEEKEFFDLNQFYENVKLDAPRSNCQLDTSKCSKYMSFSDTKEVLKQIIKKGE